MATRSPHKTKKAAKAFKESAHGVGGASTMVKVGTKMMSKAAFSKLMKKHSMAPNSKELSASKGLVKRYRPSGSKRK